MNWIKVSDGLPPIHQNTGESDYVFVFPGYRCLPQVAKWSDGTWSKKGWHPASNLGVIIPMYIGRGVKRHLSYSHWCEIVFPKDENE